MTASYTFGTVTVAQGSSTVTGDGTGWDTANISPGYFGIDTAGSIPVPVLEVVSDTELTLVSPWRGADASGVAYWLSYDTRDGQQTVNNAQRLAEYIARLDSAALAAINGLQPEDQTLILFTGSTSATLIPIGQVGGLFDVQVATLADLASYSNRPQGFRVLVADTGDGIAALYTKRSDVDGDWSTPAYLTGPRGETGETGPPPQFVQGTTTTLPSGSNATASIRTVSENTYALDVGLPRGIDGNGAGDMIRSFYDPQNRQTDIFASIDSKVYPGGRLTLTGGVSVTTADVAGSPNVHYIPASGSFVPVFDGTRFVARNIGTGVTLTLDADSTHYRWNPAGYNYDVFAVMVAGALRICTVNPWINGTTRSTGNDTSELELFGGLWVNKNAMTVRYGPNQNDLVTPTPRLATYLGTIRTTADGQVDDTLSKRFLYNAYNQARRKLTRQEPATSWNYSVAAARLVNGNAANRVEVVVGLGGSWIELYHQSRFRSSIADLRSAFVFIGVDQTTSNGDVDTFRPDLGSVTQFGHPSCNYRGNVPLGYHSYNMLEQAAGVDTQTWYSALNTTKMIGEVVL